MLKKHKIILILIFIISSSQVFSKTNGVFLHISYKENNKNFIKTTLPLTKGKWVVVSQYIAKKQNIALLRTHQTNKSKINVELLILSGEHFFKVKKDVAWKLDKMKTSNKTVLLSNNSSVTSKVIKM